MIDLYVFQENTNIQITDKRSSMQYFDVLQEYTKSSCLLECRARFKILLFGHISLITLLSIVVGGYIIKYFPNKPSIR